MQDEKTSTTIREFQPGDEAAFRRLNEEWITRFFKMEPKDEEAFAHAHEKILAPGGRIFFAMLPGEPIACCALIPIAPGEYEVAKMAVTASAQGAGVGRRVLQACIDAAREAHATRLYLETNHVLTPAIHLYESLGFQHLPSAPSAYARADVFMELLLSH